MREEAFFQSQHRSPVRVVRSLGDLSVADDPDCLAASPAVLATVGMVRDLLRATLDTVLSNQMVCSVLNGSYERKLAPVSVAAVVAGILGVRCKLVVAPARFVLDSDSKLLRVILVSAIANAVKYGCTKSPLVTIRATVLTSSGSRSGLWDCDCDLDEVSIEVINQPGANHRGLLAVDAPDAAFHRSRVDGACIMRKCATALGGTCSLHFEQRCTRFQLTLRAKVLEPRTAAAPRWLLIPSVKVRIEGP